MLQNQGEISTFDVWHHLGFEEQTIVDVCRVVSVNIGHIWYYWPFPNHTTHLRRRLLKHLGNYGESSIDKLVINGYSSTRCGTWRNCSLWAISSFATFLFKRCLLYMVKCHICHPKPLVSPQQIVTYML